MYGKGDAGVVKCGEMRSPAAANGGTSRSGEMRQFDGI